MKIPKIYLLDMAVIVCCENGQYINITRTFKTRMPPIFHLKISCSFCGRKQEGKEPDVISIWNGELEKKYKLIEITE